MAEGRFIGPWHGETIREDGGLCRADLRTVFPFPPLGGGLHFFVQGNRWMVFRFSLLIGGLHFFMQRDRWTVFPFPLLGWGLHIFV